MRQSRHTSEDHPSVKFFIDSKMWLTVLLAVLATNVVFGKPIDDQWWKTTTVYQIYPRSFKDSNADGIGDLKGITDEMEHFVDMGIGTLWLSPIYKSPMVDFGYDISDFRAIHPEYGTMEDFEEMIAKAKKLGLKVVLDFVPNHASDQSDYFKLSENRTKGYEDFFVWDDGLPDSNNASNRLPPSNWVSQFQGSAWQWHPGRGQYYLKQFSVGQPDLNYRNPDVVQEMKDVLTFWLDKGVDGFRIDALPYMFEADKEAHGGRYPDDPLSYAPGIGPDRLGYTDPIYSRDQPETYDMVSQWRKLLDDYSEKDGEYRFMLTEAYANLTMTMKFYEANSNLPFNFDFITNVNKNSNARDFVYTALRWLTYMPNGKIANWVLGNHDNSRMASRFGEHLVDGLNMLQMMLPGVPVIYQGDEIGMLDGYVSYEDTVDVSGCNAGPDEYQKFSRDPARTPFQFDDSKNAGFSTANKTWLPVAQNYKQLNLKQQKAADRSHYKVFQDLIMKLRIQETIKRGDYKLRAVSENVLILIRKYKKEDTYTLLVNMGKTSEKVDISQFDELPPSLNVFISSVNSARKTGDSAEASNILMESGEAIIFKSPSV